MLLFDGSLLGSYGLLSGGCLLLSVFSVAPSGPVLALRKVFNDT